MNVKTFVDDNGDTVRWEHDDLSGQVTIKKERDVSPILDHNRVLAETNPYNADGSMRRVASVPVIVLQEWCREDGIDPASVIRYPRAYRKWLRSKLYDPANRFMLTAPHRT